MSITAGTRNMGKSDEQLMREFLDGDPAAFDALLERYRRLVYAMIMSTGREPAEADDIFQGVFLKVIRSSETFDNERRFSSWLFKITDNTCIDALRTANASQRRYDGDEDTLNHSPGSRSGNPDAQLMAEERRRALWNAMSSLSEVQRQVIVLRELVGYSYEEISQMLSRPLNSVFSDMYRGLKRLRETWPEGKHYVESE